MKPLIKNPLPSINGLKEIYANISLNLIIQLCFNPYLAPYGANGDLRGLFQEGVICTIVSVFIITRIIANIVALARANHEFDPPPRSRLWSWMPRNKWLFALLLSIPLAGMGGGLFVFIFVFYGFAEWTFYQFLWIKIAYLTILSKVIIGLCIARFTQPDMSDTL